MPWPGHLVALMSPFSWQDQVVSRPGPEPQPPHPAMLGTTASLQALSQTLVHVSWPLDPALGCVHGSNMHSVTSHRQSQVPALLCFAVTATFLHPPSACARRRRQAHNLEPMCEDRGITQDTASEPGIAARFATRKAVSSTQGQTERVPHWVRSSSLCGAAVLSDGTILVSSPAK